MRTELRPLKLGEILDRTFQMYRSYAQLFMGIAAVGGVVSLAARTIQTFAQRSLQGHATPLQIQAVTTVGALFSTGVELIIYSLILGAMVHCVAAIYLDQPTGISLMLRALLPRWFRLALVTITAFVLSWGLMFVALLSIGLLTVALKGSGASNAALGLAVGAIGLSFLVLVPLGLWMSVRYSLANAVCAYEGAGLRQSLKRSVMLTKDLRGRLLVLLIVVGTIQIVVSLLLSIPTFLQLHKNLLHPPLWTVIYALLITFVASVLTLPVGGIGVALFYFDARARKEGLDIEWSMLGAPVEHVLQAQETAFAPLSQPDRLPG